MDPNPVSNQAGWQPTAESPVTWMKLLPGGEFQIDGTTYSPATKLDFRRNGTRVVKANGQGTAITLYEQSGRNAIKYWDGGWYRWQAEAPVAPPVAKLVDPVEAPAAEPPKPASPDKPKRRIAVATAALLVILTGGFVVAKIVAPAAGAEQHVAAFAFDDATWWDKLAVHTLVTHSLIHFSTIEFAYCALGIALFGWVVERNIGLWRTLALFVWSAALGVGVWQFILTPLGQAIMHDFVWKFFIYLSDRMGLEVGLVLLRNYGELYDRLLNLHGPIAGAAGALAGLMAFAVSRRTLSANRRSVRGLTALAAIAYVALGWAWVWPELLQQPTPYLVFVGGAIGGWSFCFPDKALYHFTDSLGNVMRGRQYRA